ncbi:hypothetical protein [Methanogenium sp. MK-MG]|uniref:hypothetical protein n=1 Tax=Methanogenium sp. MK-MG TaxID=2599926 RepID=UPI0013EA809F|nr:hypothetical protein [Methanogenium sp. MK-MG]KAF1077872.1 hypothetical protein MKMG_01211 [Methanogenium sp. MK-MG]
MGGEIYQAQVIRNFFETVTGPDRNMTRIFMCVVSTAKLRMEPPERITFLVDQIKKSKQKRELSIDIIDYMCEAAIDIDITSVMTAFGAQEVAGLADDIGDISFGTL